MNRQMLVVLILVVMAASAVMAVPAGVSRVAHVQGPVVATGMEDVVSNGVVADEHPFPTPLDDYTPNSIVDTAGWTYYDYQTNGTQGKAIGVDAAGYAHLVYTVGNPGATVRHVWYNVWDPDTLDFLLGQGVQAEGSTKAGFCNVVVDPAGWGYPIYHQVTAVDPHTAGGIDFLPREGAFTTSEVPLFNNMQLIWPHAAIDGDGNLHTVSAANPAPYGLYYAKGHPTFDPAPPDSYGANILWPIGFTSLGDQSYITADIAASSQTQRVAIAWLDNPGASDFRQNDVYVKISDDGGATWGATTNVTNFQLVDPNCCANIGDPNICNGDTLQPWEDVSVMVDNNNVVHVAFSTGGWYYFDETCAVNPVGSRGLIYSMIWHWDSQHHEYNKVGEAWYIPADPNFPGPGINTLMAQRPSLAQDPTTGYLYCSFQKFDSLVVGADPCFRPIGDAYVSVSTDGGRFWAVPTNVTNTAPVPGNDRSERDITIAPIVNGYVHMQYLLDHSAGSFVLGAECTETNNEIVYQRIPVDDIATSPLTPAYPLRSDSTGFPYPDGAGHVRGTMPRQFALYQNYPNPFNPNTNIQFDLAVAGQVSLRVFDITGREVAVLLNNQPIEAGAHVVEFNATDLPSGVFFYRLEAMGHQLTRKMMLVK